MRAVPLDQMCRGQEPSSLREFSALEKTGREIIDGERCTLQTNTSRSRQEIANKKLARDMCIRTPADLAPAAFGEVRATIDGAKAPWRAVRYFDALFGGGPPRGLPCGIIFFCSPACDPAISSRCPQGACPLIRVKPGSRRDVTCPSSDDLRPIRYFENGGSGSSGVRV